MVKTAPGEELGEHLGSDKHDSAGGNGGNWRNGYKSKTVLSEIGPVEIEVPRDWDGSFDPVIVCKRQRRLNGIDEIMLALTACGLATGEVAALDSHPAIINLWRSAWGEFIAFDDYAPGYARSPTTHPYSDTNNGRNVSRAHPREPVISQAGQRPDLLNPSLREGQESRHHFM